MPADAIPAWVKGWQAPERWLYIDQAAQAEPQHMAPAMSGAQRPQARA
jgi:hypothetical protein